MLKHLVIFASLCHVIPRCLVLLCTKNFILEWQNPSLRCLIWFMVHWFISSILFYIFPYVSHLLIQFKISLIMSTVNWFKLSWIVFLVLPGPCFCLCESIQHLMIHINLYLGSFESIHIYVDSYHSSLFRLHISSSLNRFRYLVNWGA